METRRSEIFLVIRAKDEKIEEFPFDENKIRKMLDIPNGFSRDDHPMIPNKEVVFYCNDNFCYLDEEPYNTVNAIGSLFYGYPIYGDVVVATERFTEEKEGYDWEGFKKIEHLDKETGEWEEDLCESWFITDSIKLIKNKNRDKIAKLHERYDNQEKFTGNEENGKEDVGASLLQRT